MEENKTLIEVLNNALTLLNQIDSSSQNSEYKQIIFLINQYLRKYCAHNIIEDDIDITPELSKRIYYCEYCMQTFIDKGGH